MSQDSTDPTPRPSDTSIDREALLQAAHAVSLRAHQPYSGVSVGAALLDREGRVHLACNVENASYGLTVCAERGAIQRAVSEGATEFVAIAIATNRNDCLPPCGACRQVLREFSEDLVVISIGASGARAEWTLSELLPSAFGPRDLD
jgi:cytidine deaminase